MAEDVVKQYEKKIKEIRQEIFMIRGLRETIERYIKDSGWLENYGELYTMNMPSSIAIPTFASLEVSVMWLTRTIGVYVTQESQALQQLHNLKLADAQREKEGDHANTETPASQSAEPNKDNDSPVSGPAPSA